MHSVLMLVVLSAPTPDTTAGEVGSAEKVYVLPDAKTPVLEFDYKGGFTPPRLKNDPVMSILADGTVLLPDRFGMSKDVTGSISADELQELLRFVLAEKKFTSIDSGKLKQAVDEAKRQKGGFAPVVADAPSTWVRVHIEGTTHEAQYYALGMAARQYPAVEKLQDFDAVATRLQRVMNVVRGGGRERIARILVLANAELKKQHPKTAALGMDDFSSAGPRADGTTYYSFNRRSEDGAFVSASVTVPEKGDATVTVRAGGANR